MFDPKKKILCNVVISKNLIKKLLISIVQSKFTSTGHHIQPIKLLIPLPSTLERRNTSTKPINNKAYYKLHYQICLHKSEMIPLKIKPKALKPSLTIAIGNQTSTQETHRTITQPKPLISLPQTMCMYQLNTTYANTKP